MSAIARSDKAPIAGADEECAIFYGLSATELTAVTVTCSLLSLPPALLLWLAAGLWALPLTFFAGTTLGIRISAVLVARWRCGKPHRWMERWLASIIHTLLPHPALPSGRELWVAWRLDT